MLISLKNVSFAYQKKIVLNDISFDIDQSMSVLGANGSGKSTLLKIMLGFLPYRGRVEILGKDVKEYSKNALSKLIAYIPQSHTLAYEYSVYDLVLMGAISRTPLLSSYTKQDRQKALFYIEKMGISELKNESYTKISGGQRQLAYIARALMQEARIIFMDEPTNGLDFGNQIKLLNILKSLISDGYHIVQTTHHPRHALYVTKSSLLLRGGKILEFGESKSIITTQNINRLYDIKYENFKEVL
ncbi:putative ABC transporter ATP-binding protein [Campylobacter majalis]|uniref:ABC transporter ATP-binding protein n=1 Tax=Campylobacter majalis TaxID=2790656 RepID=A0ABM8Q696_9BACT|nr:ABC transporter ATP-binding protein [Campylobacter majalis]CAD7288324.1 putative ABC transporter ATP-binding protein [Campylobacter majalis]